MLEGFPDRTCCLRLYQRQLTIAVKVWTLTRPYQKFHCFGFLAIQRWTPWCVAVSCSVYCTCAKDNNLIPGHSPCPFLTLNDDNCPELKQVMSARLMLFWACLRSPGRVISALLVKYYQANHFWEGSMFFHVWTMARTVALWCLKAFKKDLITLSRWGFVPHLFLNFFFLSNHEAVLCEDF